jgi:hypothetical protein
MSLLRGLCASALVGAFFASPSTISVDCDAGSDATGDGSPSKPFLTLMKARDAVRAVQPLTGPLSILVTAGTDCLPRTSEGATNFSAPLLSLEDVDSGTQAAPVTWTSTGPGRARLLAGASIPPSAWSPYAPIPGTFSLALGAGGLDVAQYGYGSLGAGGLGTCADTAMELFFNGSAMTLARYPNISPNGTWQWMNIHSVDNTTRRFKVNGTAAARALTWATAPRGWLHGFWSFDWSDSYTEIESVSAVGGGETEITTDANTVPVYGYLPLARFYAVNIMTELDAFGEYFIDVDTDTLYFIPPAGSDLTASEAFLSISDYGITTSLTGEHRLRAKDLAAGGHMRHTPVAGQAGVLSFVNIVGLDVHFARVAGIALSSTANVVVSDLDASNHGHNAVTMSGSNNVLQRVKGSGAGCEASSMYGGDTVHIVAGNNSVLDCTFTQFARVQRTYNPGIAWGGVGNTYARNTVSHAPHNGMLGGGVQNLFLENTFDTLCYEATDTGAWYAGRSWTNRGNVLQANTFINIQNRETMTLGSPSVQAIYLDDELSGTIIKDNVCIDSMTCYFVGGGRDTIVQGNTCFGATDRCVHIDNRGMNWQADSCTYNASFTGDLVQQLFDVNYTVPPYSTAFPEIVGTLANRPCVPVNISITGNRYCASVEFIDAAAADLAAWGDAVSGNVAMAC